MSAEAVSVNSPVIDFSKVSFSYGEVPVLHEVSFHVHRGEFAALLGPNGAGKTTVLRLLLGLAKPGSGTVRVLGEDPLSFKRPIGYVPQHASFDPAFPISVEEVVRMGRLAGPLGRVSRAGAAAIDRALEAAGVADLRKRSYSALSGGQRRRVLVARALAAESSLVVLDEPTANMDADSERRLYETLGALKGSSTILVVTHDTDYVSGLTDAVLCLGERGGQGRSVVRHAAAPAKEEPSRPLGGKALRVLHDTALSDQCGCEKGLEH